MLHLVTLVSSFICQLSVGSLPRSHIEANVPDAQSFDYFMDRDLRVYFRKYLFARDQKREGDVRVVYTLLRDGPTQTGAAYPKYYVWAKIFSGNEAVTEGAVRLAAVAKVTFKVIDFLPKSEIVASPEKLSLLFPAVLNEKILSLAHIDDDRAGRD